MPIMQFQTGPLWEAIRSQSKIYSSCPNHMDCGKLRWLMCCKTHPCKNAIHNPFFEQDNVVLFIYDDFYYTLFFPDATLF